MSEKKIGFISKQIVTYINLCIQYIVIHIMEEYIDLLVQSEYYIYLSNELLEKN